jgi:hypothetical protein
MFNDQPWPRLDSESYFCVHYIDRLEMFFLPSNRRLLECLSARPKSAFVINNSNHSDGDALRKAKRALSAGLSSAESLIRFCQAFTKSEMFIASDHASELTWQSKRRRRRLKLKQTTRCGLFWVLRDFFSLFILYHSSFYTF